MACEGNARLERLDWDTAHFGFPVARVAPGDVAESELEGLLLGARAERIRLVYCHRDPKRPLSAALLERFGGARLCTRAQFRRPLDGSVEAGAPEGIRIRPLEKGAAPESLRRLALETGRHSRFRRDRRIPRERREALHSRWMERSARRELASAVLVATGADGAPVGLATVVQRRASPAEIGLLAVAGGVRRSGVASALMEAAEARMHAAGASEAEVVTQLENTAACELYRARGYRAVSLADAYHFWVQPGS